MGDLIRDVADDMVQRGVLEPGEKLQWMYDRATAQNRTLRKKIRELDTELTRALNKNTWL